MGVMGLELMETLRNTGPDSPSALGSTELAAL